MNRTRLLFYAVKSTIERWYMHRQVCTALYRDVEVLSNGKLSSRERRIL